MAAAAAAAAAAATTTTICSSLLSPSIRSTPLKCLRSYQLHFPSSSSSDDHILRLAGLSPSLRSSSSSGLCLDALSTAPSSRWPRPLRVLAAPLPQEEVATTAAEEIAGEKEAAVVEEVESAAGDQGAKDQTAVPVTPTLYFGNLPRSVDSAQLAAIIQDHASPDIVEVIYDRETGSSRGFAFVTMSSVEDCEKVIENLDDSPFMGRILRVNFSDKPKPRWPLEPESEHKLFISNLSSLVTSESLRRVFQEYGNVVGVRVLYHSETGRSLGCGFVSYSTNAEMETALISLDGVELEGKAIRVQLAKGKRS